MSAAPRDWTRQREGGTRAALRLIRAIARHGGRAAGRAWVFAITA